MHSSFHLEDNLLITNEHEKVFGRIQRKSTNDPNFFQKTQQISLVTIKRQAASNLVPRELQCSASVEICIKLC